MKLRPTAMYILEVAPLIAALGLALAPLPVAWVERFYSNGIYPKLQHLLTPLTNLLPFAVIDLSIIGLALGLPAWWIASIKSAGRGRRARMLVGLAFHTLALAAVIFLCFEFLWGLNYLREPLTSKLEYDEQRLTEEAKREFTLMAIQRLNLEATAAHADPWPSDEQWREDLVRSLNATVGELGDGWAITPARPKTSVLDPYLGATGTSGFTNPFGHEVILNSDLLPFERPFTLAHEWAHLAGFADESEANFVALLACVRSDRAALRYSGWLAVYGYLPIPQAELKRLMEGAKWGDVLPPVAPEALADLRAMSERSRRRINADINRVQSRVYDSFLKANRVQAGIASYGLFVRLMLGTELGYRI